MWSINDVLLQIIRVGDLLFVLSQILSKTGENF